MITDFVGKLPTLHGVNGVRKSLVLGIIALMHVKGTDMHYLDPHVCSIPGNCYSLKCDSDLRIGR